MQLICAWLCIAAVSTAQMDLIPKQPGNQVVCDPGQFGFQDFYGFNVQHQIMLNLPLEHHTRISLCEGGSPQGFDAYRPLPPAFHHGFNGDDLVWGRKICTMDMDDNRCYIIARRRRYGIRKISLYYPDVWIGGMYLCPGELDDDGYECNNSNAIPLRPLLASDPWNAWWELPDGRHYVHRIPLAKTFDDPTDIRFPQRLPPDNWHDLIDVNEEYDYDDVELERAALVESKLRKTWNGLHAQNKTQFGPENNTIFMPLSNANTDQYPLIYYLSKMSHGQSRSFLRFADRLYTEAVKKRA